MLITMAPLERSTDFDVSGSGARHGRLCSYGVTANFGEIWKLQDARLWLTPALLSSQLLVPHTN